MTRVFVAGMCIVTLTLCGIYARENDAADVQKTDTVVRKGGRNLFDRINKNQGKSRRRTDRDLSVNIDGHSYNTEGGCIGTCCRYDDECKDENAECHCDRKICLCKAGFVLNQDGTCVNCSVADFETYTQTCPDVQICEECQTCKPYCRDKRYDIILIVDGSESVGADNYNLQRYNLLEFVSQFDISPNATRFGYISFGNGVYNSFNLTNPDTDTTVKVIERIHRDEFGSGFTRISMALEYAKEILESSGNRPDVPNQVIVLTDGFILSSPFTQEANDLKSMNDTTVSLVGIGYYIDPVLGDLIASGPDDVYNVQRTYEAITGLTVDLIEKLCA